MTASIHALIEQYGLIAVFIGCLFEGETAAILAGFFAHQSVFVPWQAFTAAALGAFGGDTMFFLIGRYFAEHPFVQRMRKKPGFRHAYALVQSHPNTFVFSNRYVYGMRLLGGVVAGLSNIALARFALVNALSSLLWASLFCGAGYFFGLGAEKLLGEALQKHHHLLIALGIAIATLIAGHFAARRWLKKQGAEDEEPLSR